MGPIYVKSRLLPYRRIEYACPILPVLNIDQMLCRQFGWIFHYMVPNGRIVRNPVFASGRIHCFSVS